MNSLIADTLAHFKPDSQSHRVLSLLADGRPWTIEGLHAHAGTMRLNSRTSEIRSKLRERGLELACWSHGTGKHRTYVYQIVGALEREAVTREPSAASPSSALTEEGPLLPGDQVAPALPGPVVGLGSADGDGDPRPSSVSALAGREAQPDTGGLTLSHPDIPAGLVSHEDQEARDSRPAGALADQLVLTGAPFRREPKS